MKSKERPWVLTKEDLIYEVKKDHEDPKSQKRKKERNNNNNNKEDLGQAKEHSTRISVRGYATRRASRP